MSNDARPDYYAMSGAEFRRAVGADPEKWAEAFIQCGGHPLSVVFLREEMTGWFRDAMEAAVKANWRAGLAEALREPHTTRTWAEMKEIAERRFLGDKPSE